MPAECAAADCKELNTKKSKYSFHLFPKDPEKRKEWVIKVNRQIRDPVTSEIKMWMPTDRDVLCSRHFEEHCFTLRSRLVKDMPGIYFLPQLTPEAVPTVFYYNVYARKRKEGALTNQRSTSAKKKKQRHESADCGKRTSVTMEYADSTLLADLKVEIDIAEAPEDETKEWPMSELGNRSDTFGVKAEVQSDPESDTKDGPTLSAVKTEVQSDPESDTEDGPTLSAVKAEPHIDLIQPHHLEITGLIGPQDVHYERGEDVSMSFGASDAAQWVSALHPPVTILHSLSSSHYPRVPMGLIDSGEEGEMVTNYDSDETGESIEFEAELLSESENSGDRLDDIDGGEMQPSTSRGRRRRISDILRYGRRRAAQSDSTGSRRSGGDAKTRETCVTEKSGVFPAVQGTTPYDFLKLFLTDEVLQNLVIETNRYFQHCKAAAQKPFSLDSIFVLWKNVSVEDMKVFVAVFMTMGLAAQPQGPSYWSTGPAMEASFISTRMSQSRFEQILQFLHIADNSDQPARDDPSRDKLFKIRPFLSAIIPALKRCYSLKDKLMLDSSGVAQGERTCNPPKPRKGGIKVDFCCEAGSGYLSRLRIHSGTDGISVEIDPGRNVVKELVEGLPGSGRTIYMDSILSSVPLYSALEKNRSDAPGTLSCNKKCLSEILQGTKFKGGEKQSQQKLLDDGTSQLGMKYRYKKDIYLLRTKYKGDFIAPRTMCNETNELCMNPAVDQFHQNIAYCTFNRQTLKWWKCAFTHFLHVAKLEAMTLYNLTHGKDTTQFSFTMELVKQMTADVPDIQVAESARDDQRLDCVVPPLQSTPIKYETQQDDLGQDLSGITDTKETPILIGSALPVDPQKGNARSFEKMDKLGQRTVAPQEHEDFALLSDVEIESNVAEDVKIEIDVAEEPEDVTSASSISGSTNTISVQVDYEMEDREDEGISTQYVKKNHVCSVCRQSFLTASSLEQHMVIHNGEKRYMNNIANISGSLKPQTLSHTQRKNHVCTVCTKAFGTTNSLTRHVRIHAGQNSHVCNVCKKTFISHAKLNLHMVIHSRLKIHVCNVCKKAFSTSDNLIKHTPIHYEQKDLVCNICKKEFSTKSSLNAHKLIHTPLAFSEPLKTHMIIHMKQNEVLNISENPVLPIDSHIEDPLLPLDYRLKCPLLPLDS